MNDPVSTIHIIDDDVDTRDALAWLFDSRGHSTTTWADGEAFLEYAKSLQAWPLAVAVMDIRMEPLSGLATFDKLKELSCPWPILFLTGHADVSLAVTAVKAGAWDFLEKPFQNNNLVDRVEAAMTQGALAADRDSEAIRFNRAFLQLSQREQEVMEELLLGHYNKVIADHLGITTRTVEFHRANIFLKMGVSSAVELAHKRGLYLAPR